MLDHELFLELQLPANGGPNCKDPTLGLGFTSAITTAASAFLISAASFNDLFGAAFGHQTPYGLRTYEAAQQAYQTWSAQCDQRSVLPFQAFTGDRPPNQHKLTALVHQKKVQEIGRGSARARIMRSSMKLPEAKTWAVCSTSTGYGTYIPHQHFTVWLQYYCQSSALSARNKMPKATVCSCHGHLWGSFTLLQKRSP